ncbi:MAG TPA: hypothetical protein VGB98_01250 [Pyrinomonadaceae bacterium]
MRNKNSLRFLVVILSAAFATAALVLADVGVRAQNTNSSTTTPEAGAENTNTAAPRRGRRRGRRRPAAAVTAPDATAPDAGATGGTGTGSGTGSGTGEGTGSGMGTGAGGQDDTGTRDLSGEQVDLSGTYTGNLSTAGGHEVGSGSATLTITGQSFTLTTEGGATHSGRIYAVLTQGATSAALYFADIQDPATNTPVVYNVRARKSGDRLTLSPAPQTRARLTFAPARGRR